MEIDIKVILAVILIAVLVVAGCASAVRADEMRHSQPTWSEQLDLSSWGGAYIHKTVIPEDNVTCYTLTNYNNVAIDCLRNV